MGAHQCRKGIPVSLTVKQFEEFVLPHLTIGKRGPAPKMSLFQSFSYVMKLLYMGCQWKELPIGPGTKDRAVKRHFKGVF
jgi:hypothetical protein